MKNDSFRQGLRAALQVTGASARRNAKPFACAALAAAIYGGDCSSLVAGGEAALSPSTTEAVAGAAPAVVSSGTDLWRMALGLLVRSGQGPGCSPWGPPAPPEMPAHSREVA